MISYHRVDMGDGGRDTCVGARYLDVLEKCRVMLFNAAHLAGYSNGEGRRIFSEAA